MPLQKDIVITGLGVICPIGVTTDDYWSALIDGRSGVRPITKLDIEEPVRPICGEAPDFEPKKYVKPRKNIKVMSDDIQLGYVAACKACEMAGVKECDEAIDPERFGVLYGADLIGIDVHELLSAFSKCMDGKEFRFDRWGSEAMGNVLPLWMLKYLPNMPACHIGIGFDARGPNDSLTLDRVSGLSAISEAIRVIDRGQTDIMIAGATSHRIHPSIWARGKAFELSKRVDAPAEAMRPFDKDRDGSVHGEGAAAYVLETREHAEKRGAKPIARVLGFAHRCHWRGHGTTTSSETIQSAIRGALDDAGLAAKDIGHVNAEGVSTIEDDKSEAQAIAAAFGDTPVTAPASYFGSLSAAAGAVEMAASVLGLEKGLVPPTLNYHTPDPECPVNVVTGEPLAGRAPTAMLLNHDRFGRAAAMVIEKAS